MKFGTDEFFEYIKDNLDVDKSSEFYIVLYKTVKKDVGGILYNSGIKYPDDEEILQDIQLAVTMGLVPFALSSDCNTEAQRNAWLKRIAKNKISDYYRKKYRKLMDEVLSLYGVDETPVIDEAIEALLNNRQEDIVSLISFVCSLNTTPDKMMAFFLNKMVLFYIKGNFNGDPTFISERFNGKLLRKMFIVVKRELSYLFTFDIPDNVYESLEKKLQAKEFYNSRFDLTPHAISECSSWILKKVRDSKNGLLGGKNK